ncbi:myelin proteolipid protein-like [Mytilus californianus]|uniref:myelin proteolipid protein-like n=1 Tax=Mytilus californianus TaxID=6549 RepID=UPI002245F6D4|nr:myelin proteolipid protein-like [Mytilus californianus]
MACENIGNCAFASLISALLVFFGVGVYCGTLYRALQIFITQILEDIFGFNVPWLEVIQIVFVVIGVVMGMFAILLLVFGFLATGATRKNVYSGNKCIMGGRVSAGFFMCISYLLNLVWIGMLGVGVVPVVAYLMVSSRCDNSVYNKYQNGQVTCINLNHYGIYRNQSYIAIGQLPPGKESVCDPNDLRRLCDKIAEAGPLFCVACAGAVVIIMGMTNFLLTLATNYTRLKISKELTEYRDAVDMEELELNSRDGGSR